MNIKRKTPVHPKAKSIHLESTSDRVFFLIHGYTGSPTDFNTLPLYLYKTFNASVKIPLLKGHGRSIESLDMFGFYDFLHQVERELQKELRKGKKIILGGYSFGGQLALYLASKYPVQGVFNISTPQKLRFPLSIPGIYYLRFFKKYWRKIQSSKERYWRRTAFYYDHMHINGIKVVKTASKMVKENLKKITVPILTIHSTKDPLAHYRTVDSINKKVSSKIKRVVLFKTEYHSLMFSKEKDLVNRFIRAFFKKHNVFDNPDRKKSSGKVTVFSKRRKAAKQIPA